MEAIGLFIIYLRTNVFLDLENTFVVPFFLCIWFLFHVWTNLVIIVHLEMESLVFFKIHV